MPNWDEKYRAAPEGLFGQQPNEYLRELVARSDFKARSALFIADGDGRNSRWLALQGVQTTALDISPVATAHAVKLDEAAGARVERLVADVEAWRPKRRRWDVVFVIYLQGPARLRRRGLVVGWEAVRRGGWLVVEAFAKAQANRDMGPDAPEMLYDLDEVAAALPRHVVIEALSGRVRLAEGRRHLGEAEVVRYAAAKP